MIKELMPILEQLVIESGGVINPELIVKYVREIEKWKIDASLGNKLR